MWIDTEDSLEVWYSSRKVAYNMRVLVDTCVIIDALQSRVPFADAAQKILFILQRSNLRDILQQRSAVKVCEPPAFLKFANAQN